MRSKRITKKLNLNKSTVANLDQGKMMMNARGGFGQTIDRTNCLACSYTCNITCPVTCVSCEPTGNIECPCAFPTLP
jgi:hypothetical protein